MIFTKKKCSIFIYIFHQCELFKSSVTSVSVLGTVKYRTLNSVINKDLLMIFGNDTVMFTIFVSSGQSVYIFLHRQPISLFQPVVVYYPSSNRVSSFMYHHLL